MGKNLKKQSSPPSRKGERIAEKYEAIYKVFEQMGPARTLEGLARIWKGVAGERQIREMAGRFKWWQRAKAYDDQALIKEAEKNKDQLDTQYRLLLDGIDATLEATFYRDEQGHVISRLDIETWDDIAKVVRIRDYLTGNTGRDPKDLSDQSNFSMAIVALLQQVKAEGHDPYISTITQARQWIGNTAEPTTTAA
jgi:hypothetical protein